MNAESTSDSESPLKFPCVFPIKVMGRHEPEFESLVVAMISTHTGPVTATSVRTRESSNGRFLAVTVTVIAESRDQLDGIYRTLTASERVLFVL